ncbi:hypothetical protein [Halomicrobium urmianum]|uniref:hypothetical protein n=1 Tax=Halomicrobium urmianum TaxID=1586233 RepID=UPI001CD9FF3F|nr:hypothetical protein [Halomicrobium urmianum]
MVDGLDTDVVGADDAADRRDEILARVTDHAGRMARELARLQGGDYGTAEFDTDAGEWTLKYEGGDVQYLRFEGRGREIYVVSTKEPPEPGPLATALDDYDALVAAFNEHVRDAEAVLADLSFDPPEVASADAAVEDRERLLGRVRDCADAMAGQLRRVEGGDYGAYSARVNGTRWELKWEDGRASYLRVGGEGGIYLLSQYEPPAPRDVRAHAGDFGAFVQAFNAEMRELSDEIDAVSL